MGLYMKRATPATMSNTHRYLAIGYFFFKRVTPRSMTTGKKESEKFRHPQALLHPTPSAEEPRKGSREKRVSEKEGLRMITGG